MKFPLIVVNFKTFVYGKKAVDLAKICEKVSKKTKSNIVLAVQSSDLSNISKAVRILVFAQHLDPIDEGPHTGWILPDALKDNGAKGTLLNHSEHKLSFRFLSLAVKHAKKIGLTTIVCASTPQEANEIALLQPDIIAIEPTELIGGNVSVSIAKPEVITQTTHSVKNIPIICGAGIKTKQDVQKAKQLGAKGVLVATGIVKAKDPEKELIGLVEGFR